MPEAIIIGFGGTGGRESRFILLPDARIMSMETEDNLIERRERRGRRGGLKERESVSAKVQESGSLATPTCPHFFATSGSSFRRCTAAQPVAFLCSQDELVGILRGLAGKLRLGVRH